MPRNDLEAAAVREMLDYDPATGILTWRWREDQMQRVNTRLVGKTAGAIDSNGRRQIRINGKIYYAYRLAWLHYYGEWPKDQIDHVNCDRSDNRIDNLREATRSQNQANTPRQSNNRSGFKGVSWHTRQKWQAQIRMNNKSRHLGLFETREEAYAAYCAAAKELHGEFARTA